MYFPNLDPTAFYDNDDYALTNYVSDPPTDELIHSIESELGYKLPAAYVALMKIQNGGMARNICNSFLPCSSNLA